MRNDDQICGRENDVISFLYGELNEVEATAFQRHLKGTMWSVFVPRTRGNERRLEPGQLVITGADTGFEA